MNTHSHRTPLRATLALILVAALLGLAACGSSSSSSPASGSSGSATTSTTHFAKTKFVLHAGLAFGAFHRYIYKPAKAGSFSHPLRHKLTLVKAGLAGAFVYHELKLALKDAQASPTLSKLVSPITALQNRIHGLPAQIKSHNVNPASLEQDNSSISSIKGQSASAGQPIQEQVPSGSL